MKGFKANGIDVDEPVELLGHDLDAARRIARLDGEREGGAAAAGQFGHDGAADDEAAPLDDAEHAHQRALLGGELDDETLRADGGRAHGAFSIISMFDLLGGTKGQTFSRGSMRAWHRIGPSVASSRSIAAGTSER